MRPAFLKELSFVSSSHLSPFGRIVSEWKRGRRSVTYNVTVPPNATADLYLPPNLLIKKAVVSTSGKAITLPRNAGTGFKLKAGSYHIELISHHYDMA